MKFNKCPFCNFYNQSDEQNCEKCGGPLPPISPTEREAPVTGYKPPTRPSTSTSKAPIPLAPSSHGSSSSAGSAAPIVPYTSPSPPARPSSAPPPPVPASPSPAGHSVFGSRYPLPVTFSRYNLPNVEGEVVDVSDVTDEDTSGKSGDTIRNVIGVTMLPFNAVAGVMTLASGLGKPKPTKSVPVLRVATPSGDMVEVRIDKQLKLGSIRKGDYISVWGKNDGGVISLWMGFNHSTNAEVRVK